MSPVVVKSAILARLNTLALGNSGVHPSVIELMKELINRDILEFVRGAPAEEAPKLAVEIFEEPPVG